MVIIDEHPVIPELVLCSFKYSLYYLNRIRGIPTARYEPAFKAWSVHKMAIPNIEQVFNGELFYKTPRWFLLNLPKPDYSSMYQLAPMTLTQLALPLFPYQEYGAKFMIQTLLQKGVVLNCDDVGLGKSPQAIETAAYMRANHGTNKILIVAKKSLVSQWKTDVFHKFLNEDCTIIGGTPAKRKKIYEDFDKQPSGAMVISYHTLFNDVSIVEKMKFDLVICDEIHIIKNHKTGKMHAAAKKVFKRIKYKVGLTGTPLAKHPDDAYGIMSCLGSNIFGSHKDFSDTYLVYEQGRYKNELIGFKNIDQFRAILQSVMIRRTEFEVDVELPEVIPVQVTCSKDTLQDLLETQLSVELTALDAQRIALTMKANKSPQDIQLLEMVESKLKGLIATRQAIANDPRLLQMSKSKAILDKYSHIDMKNYQSDKTNKLLEITETIVDSGHKVIVFTKFERQARLSAQDITKALGINVVTFTGEENDLQRETNITLFKQDPDYQVLVATDAANAGLNLQMAKYIIHFDQPDLPDIKIQRNGRIRRVSSQFKHVYSYDLATENSYDINRLDNLKNLMNTIDAFVSIDSAQSDALREAMK